MNAVIPPVGIADARESATRRPDETTVHPSRKSGVGNQQVQPPGTDPHARRDARVSRTASLASACAQEIGLAGRYWGRAGEVFAAAKLGLNLCRDYTQGHDGRMGNHLVEIKTITPLKRKPFVRVKRSGNFSLLAVVWFHSSLEAELRLIRRSRLPKGNRGACFRLSWSRACALAEREV